MPKPPRRFFTSDNHIGHRVVATVHRPFETVEEHDAYLASQWDALVRPNDIVYVLGDISISPHRDKAFEWFQARPGIKHLVMGNHDPVHPLFGSKALSEQRKPEWLETFATVNQFLRVSINGYKVMLSHFPYFGSGEGSRDMDERYSEFRLVDAGLPLLHGHTHSSSSVGRTAKQLHIGLDAWGFAPVSESEVAKWLKETID